MSITLTIIILTSIISIVAMSNAKMKGELIFWPAVIKNNNQYYRFLSYGLIHADYIHLSFNMLALYSFGVFVEDHLFSAPYFFGARGKIFFLVMYVGALVVSTIPDYIKYKDIYGYTALGASGAVSAVIFAGIILQPNLPIRFMFIPFDIPGYIFGILFLALSAYLAKKGTGNIGHVAHFFGALFGIAFTVIMVKAFSTNHVDVLSDFMKAILSR
ncbi:MAG: rhomboid family intramembrane serine protease [Sphingobacteriales bacterium 40-81]|nr:MAG: rhomboid family intramembrane serine protease [Sphingobacteriales bacterium 40-81]